MSLRDDGDRLVMVMELCGSGGVLRRGDPETGRLPHPVGEHGVNQQPHDWTWQKTGVHWYCSHCAIAMEWLPGQRKGRLLRPLDHVMDPQAPCTWYVYKDEDKTRAYHYPRTGTSYPARRTRHRRRLAEGISGRKLDAGSRPEDRKSGRTVVPKDQGTARGPVHWSAGFRATNPDVTPLHSAEFTRSMTPLSQLLSALHGKDVDSPVLCRICLFGTTGMPAGERCRGVAGLHPGAGFAGSGHAQLADATLLPRRAQRRPTPGAEAERRACHPACAAPSGALVERWTLGPDGDWWQTEYPG